LENEAMGRREQRVDCPPVQIGRGTGAPPDPRTDPWVAQFVRHLRAERNASEHTVNGYLQDLT